MYIRGSELNVCTYEALGSVDTVPKRERALSIACFLSETSRINLRPENISKKLGPLDYSQLAIRISSNLMLYLL